MVSVDCVAGGELAGSPVTFRAGAAGSATLNWKLWLAVVPALSFAVTDTLAAPATVVVPVMIPVDEIESPVGNPVALQVYGGTPPVAARVTE